MNAGELRAWVEDRPARFRLTLLAYVDAAQYAWLHAGPRSPEYHNMRGAARDYLQGGLESHDRLVDPDKLNDFLDELEGEA